MLSEDRWHEVSESAHAHEAEGLRLLRGLLPDADPYRVWTNFEFKDSQGRWYEVDAAVLGRGALHLVELKYYSGELSGSDTKWFRPNHRVEDSPLLLARRKAQRFKSKLQEGFRSWAASEGADPSLERWVVPYVKEAVFLHHPDLQSRLSGSAALGIFGIPGRERQMNLPPITDRVLEEPRNRKREIDERASSALVKVMAHLDLADRREASAGSWSLIGAIAEGGDWQDWEASHQLVQDRRARIRFHVVPEGSSRQQHDAARRVADNEFRVLQRLHHDGLLRPDDVVDGEIGRGLVYPWDEDAQRLDLWLAGRGEQLAMDERLAVVRQVAEAMHYAHRNGVVHRGLNPRALWVAERDGEPHVRIGEWQSAGFTAAETHAPPGVTSLQHDDDVDDAAAYRAPEGVWSPTANRVRLDIFGLGATAYFILAGRAPATGEAALRERLRDQKGLDITVDLPQASGTLREAILDATRPRASERTSDVGAFLGALSEAERALADPDTDHAVDPLDAGPGDLLDARFRVLSRLGAGSTAVGLLVTDAAARDAQRVLKVARDDTAAARLADEADVLTSFRGTRRIVEFYERLSLGGRECLVLSSAGTETLADRLATGQRLSLDLLQRWGEDLFEALEILERAGIDHRDIKPANLGVLVMPSSRQQHLVLFDFSLSRASASALTAGTAPYLDPFLGGRRSTYDRAAERYAAAVVLFQMATGATPFYGDPEAHPAAVDDEVTLDRSMFDPSVADDLMAFFRTALARDASQRHETGVDMRNEWRQALVPGTNTTTADGDDRAAKAHLGTALTASGLTPRALSLLEQFDVNTVGDLLAIDVVRLNAASGVAQATKREVAQRHKQWRNRLGPVQHTVPREDALLPTVSEIAEVFTKAVGKRSKSRATLLATILGKEPTVDPLAPQTDLAKALDLSAQRIGQLLNDIQSSLGADKAALDLIMALERVLDERITDLGGVATVDEITATLTAAMPHEPPTTTTDRRIAGLVRILVDRHRLLVTTDPESALVWRRHGGRFALAATDGALLDVAEAVGARAQQLMTGIDGGAEVVPADRVQAELAAVVGSGQDSPQLFTPGRLAALGASLADGLAASTQGELHSRGLGSASAMALAIGAVGPTRTFKPQELIDRVTARFPGLPTIASGNLRAVVEASGLDLAWDAETRVYAPYQLTEHTTATDSRLPTAVPVDDAPLSAVGTVGQRLLDSRRSRSFLMLGVPGDQIERITAIVTSDRFGARAFNVTERFLHHLRATNDALTKPVPWAAVRQADAEPTTSRGGRGLRKLAEQAIAHVVEEITELLADAEQAPVLLTEASPLARYGQTGALTRWSDLSRPREQALWLLLPQLVGHQGALLEGVPVQSSPNQFVAVDRAWIGTQWTKLTDEKVGA